VLIREYTPADLEALRRMHASQGFDYPFPDLSDPIFISKLVVEDDEGRSVMASLARLTCEMYLLMDREGDPAAFFKDVIPPALTQQGRPASTPSVGDGAERSAAGFPHCEEKAHPSSSARQNGGLVPVRCQDSGGVRRTPETGDDTTRGRDASVEAQGFSPAKKDARHSRSALPEAVAEALAPQRQKVVARERWAQLLALHRAGERDLLARGLDDAHAWLPPRIAKRFGRRLESLGWLRDDTWTPYCRRLRP